MRYFVSMCGVFTVCFLMLVPATTPAKALTMTFDNDPALGATQAPGVWYDDRYAPAGFSSEFFMGDNRLALTLSENDSATNRPAAFSSSFYDTQGRKFDLPSNSIGVSVDMFIAADFENDPNRIGGLWATAFNQAGDISFFPIIEFFDNQFHGWDGVGWVAMGLPASFGFDQFYTLGFVLDTVSNMVAYTVDGEIVATVGANTSLRMGNVILQGINRGLAPGQSRTLYFDNLSVAPVPLPAPLALLASAIFGIVLLGRRRNQRVA